MSPVAGGSHRSYARVEKNRSKNVRGSEAHRDKGRRERASKAKGSAAQSQGDFIRIDCAIFTPMIGNTPHWALAIFDPNRPVAQSHELFQVVQEKEDAPFERSHLVEDPTTSTSCHVPLTHLGTMGKEQWDKLPGVVDKVPVPGEAESWNCQDYVMEIWEGMQDAGLIDHATWASGREKMLGLFGSNLGIDIDEEGGDDSAEDQEEEQERRIVSDEFVYDSE